MKRNFNNIKDADIDKIKIRSKNEIINRIVFLENEHHKEWENMQKYVSEGKHWQAGISEGICKILRYQVEQLDWVLNINN